MKTTITTFILAGALVSSPLLFASVQANAQSPASLIASQAEAGGVKISYAQFRHGGFRGRRSYGRRFYGGRFHRRGFGTGALIGGLAAGALIGGAIASQAAPAPAYLAPQQDATSYCLQRFKSFDPASGSYLGYDGQRHSCP